MLFYGTPPLCTISCKALPGHSVDVDSLHISHADIFISKVMVAGCSTGSPFYSPMPVHHRVCISECDHHQYGGHDHRSLHCLSRVYTDILGRPTRDRTSALVTLSSQDIPRIWRMLLRWNVLNLLSCPACVFHVSLPYSNALITQAM